MHRGLRHIATVLTTHTRPLRGRMRMESFVGFVFYAVLVLVGREATLVQGESRSANVSL